MWRTTLWLAISTFVACGCTLEKPHAPQNSGGAKTPAQGADSAGGPAGADETNSTREAADNDTDDEMLEPDGDTADPNPGDVGATEPGADDAETSIPNAADEAPGSHDERDAAAGGDEPSAIEDGAAIKETTDSAGDDEPADDKRAADDDADDAPQQATVDQLLLKVQKLAQKEDIDGMLGVLKQALQVDPKHRQVLADLCTLLEQQAAAASKSENDKEAYSKYKEGARYARALRDHYKDLNRNEQRLVSSMLYNEACAFALENDADKALASLNEAVDAGFAESDQLAKDTDLAVLHDRDEFKELLDKVSQNADALRREEAKQARAAEEQMLERMKKQFAAGETFPFDFTLSDLDDKPVSLADYKGKVLIVDIWGTWCRPCRMEIPHFIELKKRYEKKGFDIVGINYESLDPDEAKAKIADFVKESGINYKCVIGDDETQAQVPDFEGYPTTLFIDRTGKVRMKTIDVQPLAALEWIVQELVSEKGKASDDERDESGDDDAAE